MLFPLYVTSDDLLFAHVNGSIVGYSRPDTLSRFCYKDGEFRSLHKVFNGDVTPAPSFGDLLTAIQRKPSKCLPKERGLFFEAIELICFALGYKAVVLRQRYNRGHPLPLFEPHVQELMKYLLGRSDVITMTSKNQWATGYEETLVFAREMPTAVALVELRAQDATVPGHDTDRDKAVFIAKVGRLLGYPHDSIVDYLDEVMPGYDVLGEADEYLVQVYAGDLQRAQYVVAESEPFPPLVNAIEDILHLDLTPQSLLDFLRPTDWLYEVDSLC